MSRDINNHTVYIFMRQDLTQEQQMVHTAHTTLQRPQAEEDFGHPIVGVLGVPDIARLEKAERLLNECEIGFNTWIDPDKPELGKIGIATLPLSVEEKQPILKYRLWRKENNKCNQLTNS